MIHIIIIGRLQVVLQKLPLGRYKEVRKCVIWPTYFHSPQNLRGCGRDPTNCMKVLNLSTTLCTRGVHYSCTVSAEISIIKSIQLLCYARTETSLYLKLKELTVNHVRAKRKHPVKHPVVSWNFVQSDPECFIRHWGWLILVWLSNDADMRWWTFLWKWTEVRNDA